MNPFFDDGRRPVWTYEDLALFIGSILPAFALAFVLIWPFHFRTLAVRTISMQMILYALLLGMLYFLSTVRHGRPLRESLGWTFRFSPLWIALGPPLAVALAIFAAELRAPQENMIQDLITNRASLILMLIFGALVGPIFEEIFFRGFLLPLVARSIGDVAGVLLTAALFATLHGPEYHWAWQVLLTVGLAGLVFGIARIKTGSTAAAAMLHIGYNGTLFVGYLVERSL